MSEEILRALERLEGKMDAQQTSLNDVREKYASRHADHESRILHNKEDIDGLGDDVRRRTKGLWDALNTHVDKHWQYLIGTTALVGAIMTAAHFLSK